MNEINSYKAKPVGAHIPAEGETAAASRMAALSHTTRLAVFRRLMRSGPDGVAAGVLAEELGVSPSNLSAHLNILTHAELVVVRKDGRRRLYAPVLETVRGLVDFLVDECCDGHPDLCRLEEV